MKSSKSKRYLILTNLVLLFSLLIMVQVVDAQPSQPITAKEKVTEAWHLAKASNTYQYRVHLDQTTYPAPKLGNAGKQPQHDTMTIEGALNQTEQLMEMRLWQTAVKPSPDQILEIQVKNGQAMGRIGLDTTWEPMNDISQSFAPNNDPLAFLAGATNIQQAETETRNYEGLSLTLTRYTFQMDGPAYAKHADTQLQKHLYENGKLPKGLELESTNLYRTMTGNGEIWLDADGLPYRLHINMFLRPESGERLEATITTDYSHFDHAVRTTPAPLSKLQQLLPATSQGRQLMFAQLAIFLSFMLLVLLSIPYWQRHAFRKGTMIFMAITMVLSPFTPMLQALELETFHNKTRTSQEEEETRQAEAKAHEQLNKQLTQSSWNPHQSPLSQPELSSPTDGVPVQNLSFQAQLALTNNTTDTDGDGLLDVDELYVGSCGGITATPDFCDGVVDPTDTDGDGLDDNIEVTRLDTLPMVWDSDGDSITDTLEVTGFFYNGQQWYLDPNNVDSNRDGIPDGAECPQWVAGTDEFNPALPCQDTDSDGTPDVFDNDNDGDTIPDKVDMSPYNSGSTLFTENNPLDLNIQKLTPNKPVFVNLQIVPDNPNHLNYLNSVIDWPSPDLKGQVQRGLNTTFATAVDPNNRSTAANAANGEVRVVPMLEIMIPYNSSTHYGNLPIKTGANPTNNSNLASWLGREQLDPYGITVNQADVNDVTKGWVVYAPLSPVTSNEGDQVAFGAQMLYWPTVAGGDGTVNWGADHEYRIIWMVQMLTDRCQNIGDNPETCTRVETLSIIHNYKEDWRVGGMEVREEQGYDVAIMYEDPALDNNLASDDFLWMSSWNMGTTFIRGRDCETLINNGTDCTGNNMRDVTVANLGATVPTWFTNTATIPLQVTNRSYAHSGYLAHVMMTDTVSILNTTFTSYASQTNPTFLFATEDTTRRVNLNELASFNSNQTIDFDQVPTITMASMSWAPYRYAGGSWENMPLQTYLDSLDTRWKTNNAFGVGLDLDDRDGRILWAQMYYAQLTNGFTSPVETNGAPIFVKAFPTPEIRNGPIVPQTTFFGAGVAAGTFVEALLLVKPVASQLGPKASAKLFFKEWMKSYRGFGVGLGATEASMDPQSASRVQKMMQKSRFATANNVFVWGLSIVAIVASYALLAGMIGSATGGGSGFQTVSDIAIYALNVVSGIMAVTMLATMINTVRTAVSQGGSALKTLFKFSKMNRAFVNTPAGLVIGLVLIWGMFVYQLAASGNLTNTNSIAFNSALAYAVAATAVLLIFFILDFTLIGSILVLLILLIDIILFFIPGVNFSIQGWLTEAIAELAYDVSLVPTNLSDSSRLDFRPASVTLTNPREGFTALSNMDYAIALTNTLTFNSRRFNYNDIKQSTFAYNISGSQNAQHNSLNLNTMTNSWQQVAGRNDAVQYNTTLYYTLWLWGVGINRNFPNQRYLTESFVVPYVGCWRVYDFGISALLGNGGNQYYEYDCTTESLKNSQHIDLGQYEYYDLFPLTLDNFMKTTATSGSGYTYQWFNQYASASERLPAVTAVDADNDGLRHRDAGGSDPDDSKWDTDGDGLNDKFEIENNMNPTLADTDGDGLLDGEELEYGTSPILLDTDNDQLNDYFEVKTGWLISYGGGNVTRVWSDPLVRDKDLDGLADLEERMLGLHPEIAVDPSVLNNLVQIDGFRAREDKGVAMLHRFEEENGATQFLDSSGNSTWAFCQATCITTGYDGPVGNSARFFGWGVDTNYQFSQEAQGFSMGGWVYPNTPIANMNGYLMYGSPSFLGFDNYNNIIEFWLHDSPSGQLNVPIDPHVTPYEWNHIMATYDKRTGDGKLFVNGIEVGSKKFGRGMTSNNITQIGGNTFNGYLDEMVLYEYPLTATEIQQVMQGRYNVQDRVLTGDNSITYEATVTNTHPTLTANGNLLGQSYYAEPIIQNATSAYSFESAQFSNHYTTDTGSDALTLSCNPAFNECPATVIGPTTANTTPAIPANLGNALLFDGVDDFLNVPAIGSTNQGTMSMWLNLNSLPTSEQTMSLWRSSTSNNGNIHLSVWPTGQLGFQTINANITTHTADPEGTPVIDGCCTGGDIHFSHYSFNGNLNQWVHVTIDFSPTSTDIYINGTLDSTSTRVTALTEVNLDIAEFGRGDNEATVSFDGSLDSLAVYRNSNLCYNSCVFGQPSPGGIYYGTYAGSPAHFPLEVAQQRVQNMADVLGGYATCASGSCPTFTSNGRYGSGLSLSTGQEMNLGLMDGFMRNDYTISGWFKTSNTNASNLFDAFEPLGAGRITFVINESGQLYYLHGGLAGSANWQSFGSGTGYNDGQWHHVMAIMDNGNMSLYIDGVQNGSATIPVSPADAPLQVRLGNASTSPFIGDLDEWVVWPSAIPTDAILTIMNGAFPAMTVNTPIVPFSTAALNTTTIEGSMSVATHAPDGVHTIDIGVDVALENVAINSIPIFDPVAVGDLTIYAPFEDAPGSTTRLNIAGSDNFTCSDPNCPTAGLPGRDNRAAYFDGVNDSLAYNTATPAYDFGTIAVWVNATNGTIIDNVVYQAPITLETDRFTIDLACGGEYTLNYSLPQNTWAHLAVTMDWATGNLYAYINGQQVDSVATAHVDNDINCYRTQMGSFILGSNQSGFNYLNGYLDDLRAYNRHLTAGEVQTVYTQSTPRLYMAFDELDTDTTFLDSSDNRYVGVPYAIPVPNSTDVVLSPQPGIDGKIGNTALFDGSGYIEITDATALSNPVNNFSAMAWLRLDDYATSPRILAHGNTVAGGFEFGVWSDGRLFFTNRTETLFSTQAVQLDYWQHVAVVFDSNNDANFYINGVLINTAAGTNPVTVNLVDPVYIGAYRSGGTMVNHLSGEIDELIFYQRALGTNEIYNTYLRDLLWFKDRGTLRYVVDKTGPTITWLNDSAYRTAEYVGLEIAGSDENTYVFRMEIGLKAVGDTEFTWSEAPQCLDTKNVWCPAWDLTNTSDGLHEFQVRAFDAVGNETLSPIYSFTVETTPPTITTAYNGQIQFPTVISDSLRWQLPLAGSISDSESGVLTSSVKVTLLDPAGGVAGTGSQAATVNGNNWSATYSFAGLKPTGKYIVQVEASDRVGNVSTTNAGSITIDMRAPGVALEPTTLMTGTINQPITFSGTVFDYPAFKGAEGRYRFESSSMFNNNTYFFDDSGNYRFGSCPTGSCPTAVTGKVGQALDFNGVDQVITIENSGAPFGDKPFTLATWFKPNSMGAYGILGFGRGQDNEWGGIRLTATGIEYKAWGGISATTSDLSGEWHHVAVTHDGTSATLYLDGEPIAFRENSPILTSDNLFHIGAGNARFGEPENFFDGQIDEVHIFSRALNLYEVNALAQSQVAGVASMELSLTPFDILTPTWQAIPTAQTGVTNTTWSYSIPANTPEGLYRIEARTQDMFGNQSDAQRLWYGYIDVITPTIHATATEVYIGNNVFVDYSFNMSDYAFNDNFLVQPCADIDVVRTYNGTKLTDISGSCRLPGLPQSTTISICDAALHCPSKTFNFLTHDAAVQTQLSSPAIYNGDTLTYTLTYSNTGNKTANNVVLTHTLSHPFVLGSIQSSEALGLNQIGNQLVWQIGDLLANEQQTIVIPMQFTFPNSTYITATTEIGLIFDGDLSNQRTSYISYVLKDGLIMKLAPTTVSTFPYTDHNGATTTFNILANTVSEDTTIVYERLPATPVVASVDNVISATFGTDVGFLDEHFQLKAWGADNVERDGFAFNRGIGLWVSYTDPEQYPLLENWFLLTSSSDGSYWESATPLSGGECSGFSTAWTDPANNQFYTILCSTSKQRQYSALGRIGDDDAPIVTITHPPIYTGTTAIVRGTVYDPYPVGGAITQLTIDFNTTAPTFDMNVGSPNISGTREFSGVVTLPIADNFLHYMRSIATDGNNNTKYSNWELVGIDSVAPTFGYFKLITDVTVSTASTLQIYGVAGDRSGVASLTADIQGPNGFSATESWPNVFNYRPNWTAYGAYTVTLTAVDTHGQTSTDTIHANIAPVCGEPTSNSCITFNATPNGNTIQNNLPVTVNVTIQNGAQLDLTGATVTATLPAGITIIGDVILTPALSGTVSNDPSQWVTNLNIPAEQSVDLQFTILPDVVADGLYTITLTTQEASLTGGQAVGHIVYNLIPNNCYAEINGDNITDFYSVNGLAVQQAVDAVADGGTVKLGGTCVGTSFVGDPINTQPGNFLTINKNVTIEGGYSQNNWTIAPQYTTPTILDANGANVVVNATGGTIILRRMTIQNGNRGIVNGTALTIEDVLVQNNNIVSQNGGAGIQNYGSLTIDRSTIMNNSATDVLNSTGGGGLYSGNNSNTYISNSTFTGNHVDGYTLYGGAGIFKDGFGGQLHITNATIASNTVGSLVAYQTGGIYGSSSFAGTDTWARGTIVANNTGSNCDGNAIYDDGVGNYIFDSDNSCLGRITADPLLLPVADNYGWTPTMMPQAGSPAVNSAPSCLTIDQRNVSRTSSTCDYGAVERVSATITAGENFQYVDNSRFQITLYVNNINVIRGENIVVTHTIQSSTYISDIVTSSSEGVTPQIVSSNGSSTTFVWSLGSYPTGSTLKTITLSGFAPDGTVLTSTASIDGDNVSPVVQNVETYNIDGAPNLVVDITAIPASTVRGGDVTYVIRFTNTGNRQADYGHIQGLNWVFDNPMITWSGIPIVDNSSSSGSFGSPNYLFNFDMVPVGATGIISITGQADPGIPAGLDPFFCMFLANCDTIVSSNGYTQTLQARVVNSAIGQAYDSNSNAEYLTMLTSCNYQLIGAIDNNDVAFNWNLVSEAKSFQMYRLGVPYVPLTAIWETGPILAAGSTTYTDVDGMLGTLPAYYQLAGEGCGNNSNTFGIFQFNLTAGN